MIKDSGTRREFDTGSVRDMSSGKGRYDLIPYLPQENLAKHYEAGIKKYGERNWERGQPLQVFLDCGLRHFNKFMGGMRDEDHLSASVWNAYAYQWTENEVIEGRLPFELTKNLNPVLLKYIEDKMEQKRLEEVEQFEDNWRDLWGSIKYDSQPPKFRIIPAH